MLPKQIQNLIFELSKLPGVGEKSAERLAFHLLREKPSEAQRLGESIASLHEGLALCPICQHITESDRCKICDDSSRNHQVICVVEEPLDLIAIERGGHFSGLYHVLHGALSPVHGILPGDLKITELIDRVKNESVEELIIATNHTMEGEATAMYLQRELDGLNIQITRIARGLPSGSDIEYADELTLRRALEGRAVYC